MGRAAKQVEPMRQEFSNNASMYSGASDVEPMPDLNDPQLMMKLSRMLEKSMARGPAP